MKRNWTEIVPELGDWTPKLTSPATLARSGGRYPLALGYASIFWPTFVEYEDMIFCDEEIDDEGKKNIESWLKSKNGDKQGVEAMLNHLHVLHIQHPGLWSSATEPQIRLLGQTLKEMWACKLALDFPQRLFRVELIEGSPENLSDYQVTFFQERP